jgi:hypothetical protein
LIFRWKYAIYSVLEVHIRRYTQMWSWSNIKKHRELLKCYRVAYKNKLTQSKVSEELQKQIQVYFFFMFLRAVVCPTYLYAFNLKQNIILERTELISQRECKEKMLSVVSHFFLLKKPLFSHPTIR